MTTPPTQIISSEHGYNSTTSIKSYSEFMLNKMMFEKLLNPKNTMEFTPSNIGKLALLMCAPDIKSLVIELGKYLASIVKECPQYLFTIFKYIYNTIQTFKQTVKQAVLYTYNGSWLKRNSLNTLQSEQMTNIYMSEYYTSYPVTIDNIFVAELIKFIESNKYKYDKSCIDININGVNIIRQYKLNNIVIDWFDNDTNQHVEISINEDIKYITSAKLINPTNETLTNIYKLKSQPITDTYVFPDELNIKEYWDLLHDPIFKQTWPFLMPVKTNTYAITQPAWEIIKPTSLYKSKENININLCDLYLRIKCFIEKQKYRVYGIPNANPEITTHCLTLIMLFLHLGANNNSYINYGFENYTINPLLINTNFASLMRKIKGILCETEQCMNFLNIPCRTLESYINTYKLGLDVFQRIPCLYQSCVNQHINFGKGDSIFTGRVPLILNGKINRTNVTHERFDKFMNNVTYTESNCTKNDNICINISLKSATIYANFADILTKFLEKIRTTSVCRDTDNNKSVAVKYIKLKQTDTITETDNPDYKEWLKKKDLILSNISITSNVGTINNLDEPNNTPITNQTPTNTQFTNPINNVLPYLVETMPPEKLSIVESKLNIDEQTINNTYRQMQSLSLKTKDKKKLMCALDDYLEDGATLKAWGIKNKLNILLYGEPGTGKSSTIEAIATYLNKPIYYVDMKEAKTNNDLKLIFNHVNSVAVGGGIIVMEDIDAMTTCVHKRISEVNANAEKNMTVSSIMAEQNMSSITLEFFLNILDGVLTADKSIFITTTNHIEKLDPAFYRAGRFNLKIELSACNHEQMNYIYKNMRGQDIPSEILRNIPEKVIKPAEFIYHIKDYVRDFTLSDAEILEPFITCK